MTNTDPVAALVPFFKEEDALMARRIDTALETRSIKMPRIIMLHTPPPLAVGPVLYPVFFDRPHILTGVELWVPAVTTSVLEIDIEYTANAGSTWATAMSSRPTIASGKQGGGALVSFGLGTNVGGVEGTFSLINVPRGYGFRVNIISLGGATQLSVQLLTETPVTLMRQAVRR